MGRAWGMLGWESCQGRKPVKEMGKAAPRIGNHLHKSLRSCEIKAHLGSGEVLARLQGSQPRARASH